MKNFDAKRKIEWRRLPLGKVLACKNNVLASEGGRQADFQFGTIGLFLFISPGA
jgi:hypothetical protein